MQNLTKDLPDVFFTKLKEVAARLCADPLEMMMVMQSESGVRATAHNPNGDASGLIQFMPNTLRNMGWRQGDAAFRQLTPLEQLPFVERYYMGYKGKLDSIAGLYVATFLPAEIEHRNEPDYVLSVKGGHLGWAYLPNASFDQNKDYKITVEELEMAVKRNCIGNRWLQLEARLTGGSYEEPPIDINGDLSALRSVQAALNAVLGIKLNTDGVMGPKTHAAIVAFQQKAGLTPDGIYGPLTRKALEDACVKLG